MTRPFGWSTNDDQWRRGRSLNNNRTHQKKTKGLELPICWLRPRNWPPSITAKKREQNRENEGENEEKNETKQKQAPTDHHHQPLAGVKQRRHGVAERFSSCPLRNAARRLPARKQQQHHHHQQQQQQPTPNNKTSSSYQTPPHQLSLAPPTEAARESCLTWVTFGRYLMRYFVVVVVVVVVAVNFRAVLLWFFGGVLGQLPGGVALWIAPVDGICMASASRFTVGRRQSLILNSSEEKKKRKKRKKFQPKPQHQPGWFGLLPRWFIVLRRCRFDCLITSFSTAWWASIKAVDLFSYYRGADWLLEIKRTLTRTRGSAFAVLMRRNSFGICFFLLFRRRSSFRSFLFCCSEQLDRFRVSADES